MTSRHDVISDVLLLVCSYFWTFFVLLGEENLRFEEEEPRVGEVQVCSRLQDQGTEEADRAARKRHQGKT